MQIIKIKQTTTLICYHATSIREMFAFDSKPQQLHFFSLPNFLFPASFLFLCFFFLCFFFATAHKFITHARSDLYMLLNITMNNILIVVTEYEINKKSNFAIFSSLKCLSHVWRFYIFVIFGNSWEKLWYILSVENFIFVDLFAVKVDGSDVIVGTPECFNKHAISLRISVYFHWMVPIRFRIKWDIFSVSITVCFRYKQIPTMTSHRHQRDQLDFWEGVDPYSVFWLSLSFLLHKTTNDKSILATILWISK